jgi:regulator of cell morphogenesis and NO signaling
MDITAETTLAELVDRHPATIPVLQHHDIQFCCGSRVPIRDICAHEDIEIDGLLSELRAATLPFTEREDWDSAPLNELIAHILERYHVHHREELPRLQAMLDRVIARHGDAFAESLSRLSTLFSFLSDALAHHMRREEAVLFPAIAARTSAADRVPPAFPLREAIAAMERDHRRVEWAVEQIEALTQHYRAPDGACPTFRGLYYGLGDLARRLVLHVHLEDDILFRRALGLATPQS